MTPDSQNAGRKNLYNLVWASLAGFAVGAFVVVFVVYPPRARWNDGIHMGDVATWLSSIATTAAVIVALRVAAAEGRRAAAESDRAAEQRTEEERLNDYRTSLLFQPILTYVEQACVRVLELIRYSGNEFTLGDRDRAFERAAFQRLAALSEHAKGVSPHLGAPLIKAVAHAQRMDIAIETCLRTTPVSENLGNKIVDRYVFNDSEAKERLRDVAKCLAAHVAASTDLTERTVANFFVENAH